MADLEPADLFAYETPAQSSFQSSQVMRDNFAALARQHYTTDDAKPLGPRDGQPRINASSPGNVKFEVWLNGAWRTLLQNIGAGLPAPIKQISQVPIASAASAWTVDHNLGSQPLALVYDELFRELTPAPASAVPYQQQSFGYVPGLSGLAGTQVLAGFNAPFDGYVRGLFVSAAEDVTGPVDITLDVLIGGTPVVGGAVALNAAQTRGDVINASAITDAFAFALGDLVQLRAQTVTPPGAGSLNAHALIERDGYYFLQHVNENRLVVTHPVDRAGFVILVG